MRIGGEECVEGVEFALILFLTHSFPGPGGSGHLQAGYCGMLGAGFLGGVQSANEEVISELFFGLSHCSKSLLFIKLELYAFTIHQSTLP